MSPLTINCKLGECVSQLKWLSMVTYKLKQTKNSNFYDSFAASLATYQHVDRKIQSFLNDQYISNLEKLSTFLHCFQNLLTIRAALAPCQTLFFYSKAQRALPWHPVRIFFTQGSKGTSARARRKRPMRRLSSSNINS